MLHSMLLCTQFMSPVERQGHIKNNTHMCKSWPSRAAVADAELPVAAQSLGLLRYSWVDCLYSHRAWVAITREG